ncbi:toprim domain-containing protein [Labilibaculum manganireducens]|uniref:toprim domain-containing protein n=1 Tax=Labilibaculum manganireducens TaxID=1940525 RepID=UPI0029F45DCC|nr:toprim domain-containing protein [Labilibaculum manganireducens]
MNKNNKFYSSDLIERIKNNTELQLNIIQQFIPQAKPNKKFKLHDEKTPSSILKLHEGKYWIKNFGGSDKAKDCFNIAQEALGCDMPELLRYLKNNFLIESTSISESSQMIRTAFEKQIYAIKCNSTPEVTKYLEKRGIDTESLPKNAFYQNNNINGNADALVFFDKDEKLINKRFLNVLDGQRYCNKGCLDGAIYDICFKADSEQIFIVEGVINSLSLADTESSIAIFSSSNNITADHLRNYITNKHVVLALDNDKAGNEAAEKIYDSIMESNIEIQSIKRCVFPVNKDCNDLLQENQLTAFLSEKKNYKQLFPEFIPNSENKNEDIEEFNFFKRNSCYYVEDQYKGKVRERRISNFIMTIFYFLPDGSDDANRIFFLQNRSGKSKLLTISSKNLNVKSFKSSIASVGGFSFLGTQNELDIILESLREREDTAHNVGVLGYQPEFNLYAFSNGVIHNGSFRKVDRFGVVKANGKCLYIPAFSVINKYSPWFDKERKFNFSPGKIKFKEWSNLFYKAYQDKAAVGICFLIGALFRDIIFKEIGFFPFVFLFGGYGVGKTSFSEILLNLFGADNKGLSLEAGSTSKSVARSADQQRNALLYLKELDSKIESKIVGFLKTAYDGIGYSRAQTTQDNKTHDTQVNSAIMLDGNYLPIMSSALFSRMIILNFASHLFSDEETKAFQTLKKEGKSGFGNVILEILKQRSDFLKEFKEQFDIVYHELKYQNHSTANYSERNVKHVTLLLAIYKVISSKLEFPMSYNELYECLLENAREQNESIQKISEVNQFWNAIEFLKSDLKINKQHYRIVKLDEKSLLGIRFSLIYPLYKRFCLSQNQSELDFNTLLALLKDQKSFVKTWQKGRIDSHTIKDFGSAYLFEFEQLPLEKELWLK